MLESIQKAFHGGRKEKDGKHEAEVNGSHPQQAGGGGAVLREGVLGVARKDKVDQRFVVLHRDHIVCYKDGASAHNSGKARWRIALRDINDLEEVGAGIRVSAGEDSLTLRANGAEDLRAWKTALEDALAAEKAPKVQVEEPLLAQANTAGNGARQEVHVEEVRVAEVRVVEEEHAAVEEQGAEARAASKQSARPVQEAEVPAADEAKQPPAEARSRSGILHEGPLLGEFPGHSKESRHFVLQQDRLLYFGARADAEWGVQPEGTIMVADIEDLEIMDGCFAIHLRGGKSMTLHQTRGSGELDEWFQAFASVLDNDAEATVQHGGQQVHEGLLQCGSGDSWEARHAALYFDRLDFFQSRADSVNGAAPTSSVEIGNIAEVEAVQNGFNVHLMTAPVLKLRAHGTEVLGEWMRAWSTVLGAGFQRLPEGGWRRQDYHPSGPHPPMAPICSADVVVVSCKSWSEPRPQHFVVYADRLEHYDNAKSARESWSSPNSLDCRGRVMVRSIRSVQVLDDAFNFALDDHALIVRVTDAGLMEVLISALRSVLGDADDAKRAAGEGRAFADDDDEADGFAEPNAGPTLRMSLLSAASTLVMEGFLGFQHEGRLARRYCRLFNDRLDSWASGIAFEKKQAPARRLLVKDIWGIELAGGGFVLNHLGSKLGVHVGAPGDLQGWAAALRSVLSLSPPAVAKLAEQMIQSNSAARAAGSSSSTPSPMPSNASSPLSPRRSPEGKKALVPRVAGLAKSPTKSNHIRPDGTQAHHSSGRKTVVRAGSFVAARLPHKKDHVCRSVGTLDSMRALHRPQSPGTARRDVNEKVNAHVAELWRGRSMAEKVTGTARALSPRPVERFDKISHLNGERQVARPRGGGSAELTTVTGKVTEPSWGQGGFAAPSLLCMRSPRSNGGLTQKI